MRRSLAVASLVAAGLALAAPARAADYVIDPDHSAVVFFADHLGYDHVVGRFASFAGEFSFDPANLAASKLTVTIKADSFNTGSVQRDRDIRGESWFSVGEFPEIKFVGTGYAKKDDHTGTITGDLTLRGVTKPVTLDVTLNKAAENPMNHRNEVGFTARGSVKRSDFGMTADLGPIADPVDLLIEVEAAQKG